jgi:hypothetical protein
LTVTDNPHDAPLPEASVTLHETGVVPLPNTDPEGGAHAGAPRAGQLSETAGAGKVTTAEQSPGSFGAVTFAGQVIDGASVSLTTTLNEHPFPSSEVQVTAEVPTAKNVPDAATQCTAPQEPEVVGAA